MDGVLQAADEYRGRVRQRRQNVWRYAERLHRRAKIQRVCIFVVIGYVVFDPSVASILSPAAILLVPVVIFQATLFRGCFRWLVQQRSQLCQLLVRRGNLWL